MSKLIDLTNKEFGNWKVIKRGKDRIQKNGSINVYWICECQCENKTVKEISSNSLRNNRSKGCKKCINERIKYNIKYNKYDLTGEYGIGWTSNTNEEFYFDLEDYDKIKDYTWLENSNKYIFSCAKRFNISQIYLQNLIMGKNWIDHINRIKKDCRKINLRETTQHLNNINRTIQSNNTSGFIGVRWDKFNSKWYSCIVKNKKSIFLGRYINKEDAIIARLNGELKYFGEYAPQRHLFEKYGI